MSDKIDPEVYNKILFLRSKFEDIDDALLSVAAEGNVEIAKILIDNGADVNAKDKDSDSVLLKAVAAGNAPLVELLIDRGADVAVENNFGWTALLLAKEHSRNDIIKLIDKVANAAEASNNKTMCAQLIKALAESAAKFGEERRESFIAALKSAAYELKKGLVEEAVSKIKSAFTFDMHSSADIYRFEEACEKAGRAFSKMKKIEEAVFIYSKLLDINPISREALDFFERKNELFREHDETHEFSDEIKTLEKSGDIDAAIDKGVEIISKYPRNAAVHLSLAELYERQGNFERSLFEYERTLDLEPEKYKRAFLKAAQVAKKINDHKTVINNLRRVQQIFPADLNSRKMLLAEYKLLFFENCVSGAGDEAISAYERFLSVYASDAMAHLEMAYIYNNLPAEAFSEEKLSRLLMPALEKAAARILPVAPPGCDACLMLLNQIRLAFFNSPAIKAAPIIDSYVKRSEESPDDAYKCYEAGYLYTYLPLESLNEKRAREHGLQYLIKAAELDENNIFFASELSSVYYRMKIYDNALEQCEKLLKANPADSKAALMKAAVMEHRDDFDGALAEYARITAAFPECGEAHMKAIDLYYTLYKNDPASSTKFFHKIQQCKHALKNRNDLSMLHFALAYAYFKLSEFSETDIENSHMEFKQAISLDDKNIHAYHGLSELYQKRSVNGKKDYFSEAENVCRSVITKFPYLAEAYFGLACAIDNNFKTNKKNEAIAEYKKSLYLSPFNYKPHYRLALIYKGKKQNAEAVSEFIKTIELNPNCSESTDARRSLENFIKAEKSKK